jgi:hypothetical protein
MVNILSPTILEGQGDAMRSTALLIAPVDSRHNSGSHNTFRLLHVRVCIQVCIRACAPRQNRFGNICLIKYLRGALSRRDLPL